ncbi:hypothetical protein D9619_012882 [Psilocybe cf. subviscida]|uniref:Inclusion body clearance protein IML2 n=1 Tax=Psilocybe cf. subviscida TaxID=2480587 RepID=A0A8H5BIB1_9AGAR|nr:hypothetical protein D9619_012882 [Psilocybe cf. subviscida]
MGYLQCMYSLNSAHSKFTKLYKTVFPHGLPSSEPDSPPIRSSTTTAAPAATVHSTLAQQESAASLASSASSSAASSTISVLTTNMPAPPPAVKSSGFFARWVGGSSTMGASTQLLPAPSEVLAEDGPVEDLIVAGTAFGFGLFNLVFSLLPKKAQGVVGFLGFQHDRKLALQALSLSAKKDDVHGVFAGLALMTYYGVVLLLSGYQADEEKLLKEYREIVDRVDKRYPDGALWILNRAKIMRMAYDAAGAIEVLQAGLTSERKHSFAQADMLLVFELAWTLLSQRRYKEAAETFMKITTMNSWSHGTYHFMAAGCFFSLGHMEKAQSLLDAIPDLIDKKNLPTEVFIKKKLAFYKEKQARKGGDPRKYIESVKISPAEEIGIFRNNYARVSPDIARAHIETLSALTPSLTVHPHPTTAESGNPPSWSASVSKSTLSLHSLDMHPGEDLDTPDELAIRALMLGINQRALKCFRRAGEYLAQASALQPKIRVSTWVGGVAAFETAVLELKQLEEKERSRARAMKAKAPAVDVDGVDGLAAPMDGLSVASDDEETTFGRDVSDEELKQFWEVALNSASDKLDLALSLAGSSVDLSSHLDSRIVMLRDQIALKKDMMKIS